APAESVFYGSKFFGGPVKYVLAGSGHIAGVVNPPALGKYQYLTNDSLEPPDAAAWLNGATEHEGSRWRDWRAVIQQMESEPVPARKVGEGTCQPIEDAPGSYVRVRA